MQSTVSLRTDYVAPRLARHIRRNLGLLREDPAFFVMKSAARFEILRDLFAGRLRAPQAVAAEGPVRSELSSLAAADVLSREGYCLGLRLDDRVLQALVVRCDQAPSHANRTRDRPLAPGIATLLAGQRGASVPRAATFRDQQEDWAEFLAVRDDPWVRAVARNYLGTEPCYLRSEITWSYPIPATAAERLAMAQRLHCDINGFRTLKFFFYLTAVGAGCGPHSYLPKHRAPRLLRHQLLGQRCAGIPEEAILATYGAGNLVPILGPAGTGFAGDPYYFHRGDTPHRDARLLLQLEFGRRRYRIGKMVGREGFEPSTN